MNNKNVSCPFCGGHNIVKNGKLKSNGKQRWLCKDHETPKSFSETSIRNFPKTHIPYPIICLCQYFYDKGDSVKTNIQSFTTVYMKRNGYNRQKVSVSAIYSWKKKYGERFKNDITWREAMSYNSTGSLHRPDYPSVDNIDLEPPYKEEIVYKWKKIDTTPIEISRRKKRYIPIIPNKILLKFLIEAFGRKTANDFVKDKDWKDIFNIDLKKHEMVAYVPTIEYVENW